MPFIYSTATCDTIFPVYRKTEPGQASVIEKQVLIRGGANVAKGRAEFVTKYGIRTEITDEEYKILLDSPNFKKMVNAGFLKVDDRRMDAEKVASDMTPRDTSAPKIPEDYHENDPAKPIDAAAGKGKREQEDDDEDEA